MKKTIIISSLFLMWAMFASAQNETDNRERFQFGLKAGGSYSNVYDAKGEDFDADAKFGLTGGIFVAIPIGKYLGVQPELNITQKGFKGNGTLLFMPYSFKRTTTFLEIPLLMAFKPSEFITVLAGPQFSYLLSQRDEFSSSLVSTIQENEFDQDNIRKNLLGIACGLDINLKSIVLGGRMSWDIMNNKGDGTSDTPRYKNLCTQVTIGYKF
ncbi:MAG: porin family protein [Bacteroidales bacterium]|nr:porin family protein [Bacteroidales bacterium]